MAEIVSPPAGRGSVVRLCDGLIFDEDRFVNSPSLRVEEIELGDTKALLVACN